MAVLSAVFKAVDQMSDTMDKIAQSGEIAVQRWEQAGSAADAAFSKTVSSASSASQAMDKAASAAGDWTSAVGNYDKSALAAIYSTEELVEQGFKSKEALEKQAQMAVKCALASEQLARATDTTTTVQKDLSRAMDEAEEVTGRLMKSEGISAETKEKLAAASEKAANASKEVTRANDAAIAANKELAQVSEKAGASQEEMMRAAEKAANAAKYLSEANERASAATKGLAGNTLRASQEADRAAESSKKFGKESEQALQGLESAMAAAGLMIVLDKIAEGFMAASKAAAEYETCLAKISTIADPTVKRMSDISKEVLDLSMETGQGVSQLSEAAYQALSAGVNTKGAVAFSGTATKLAVGGFTEAATAVDVLTTTLNAYNLETEKATYIADLLVTTQNLGKTTVNELASSVGKVIPLASAFGVEMDNLSTAYAVMTANGIATAESTTYIKGMLGELGDTSSAVGEILEEKTGKSFAELMEQGYSLGDVMGILGDSVGGNTTAFSGLWSSAEAGVGALSLYNSGAAKYNQVLTQMRDSTGATAKAYDTMANTTTKANDRMNNSLNNLWTVIGSKFNPVLENMYLGISGVTDGITSFIAENDWLASALVGVATGIGTIILVLTGVTAVLTLYNALITISTAVTAAFGTAVGAVFWPVTLVVGAIAALAAGIAVFMSANEEANREFNELSATSKVQYENLELLRNKYDEVVEAYGENSAQAQSLAEDIAVLEAQFDSSKKTLSEYLAENDALVESHNELINSYRTGNDELNKQEKNADALIRKLESLSKKSDLSATEQQQMAAIISKLNEDMPELALSYDEVTGALSRSTEAVRKMAEAEALKRQQEADYENYIQLLQEQTALEEQLATMEAEKQAARKRMDDAGFFAQVFDSGKVKSEYNEYRDEVERLSVALEENGIALEELDNSFQAIEESTAAAKEQTVSYEEAVSSSLQSVLEDQEKLIAEYDAAKEAARSSIDSQVGLFDTMATECELSVADMQAALDSQIAYLSTYTENLKLAAQYGLDEGLILSLSDGSSESAGYIEALVSQIEALGGSTEGLSEEAGAFVDGFNAKFQEVDQAKDQFATTVAAMSTDFDGRMADIEKRMQEAIANMEMSDEAAKHASSTISAYVNQIRSGIGAARSAAEAVAAAAQQGLQSKGISLAGIIPGFATGTVDAPDMFIAGEEGPELIVGAGGSTVFPAEETSKILGEVQRAPIDTGMPASMSVPESSGGTAEKRIILEIAGSGAIKVDSEANKEGVFSWLVENIKPVLMDVLKAEVYEEGDLAYEF